MFFDVAVIIFNNTTINFESRKYAKHARGLNPYNFQIVKEFKANFEDCRLGKQLIKNVKYISQAK